MSPSSPTTLASRLDDLRSKFASLPPGPPGVEPEATRYAWEAAWERRGIPRRLWPMLHASRTGSEGGPVETPALEAVGRFLDPSTPQTILVLSGGTGVGKTVAAAWGAAFHSGVFVKSLALIRAGMFPPDDFWGRLERAPLLVIDDLGREPQDSKGYGLAALADLIDRRYDSERRTIITANLTPEQFAEAYADRDGGRVRDRIREVGRFVVIAGESRRKPFAAEVSP